MLEYIKPVRSNDEKVQKLAITIGKIENKAIIRFIEKQGLTNILEENMSKIQLNKYYRTKYKLKVLLNR